MEALVYCIGMWVSFLDKNSSEFNVAASRERTCIQLYIYIYIYIYESYIFWLSQRL